MEWTLDGRSDGRRLDVFLSECAGVTGRVPPPSFAPAARPSTEGGNQGGFFAEIGMRVYFVIRRCRPRRRRQDIPWTSLPGRRSGGDLQASGMVVHPPRATGTHVVNALLHT
jgi:hypothetical protein